jgi:pimeloyl-ACP methyl ester carboxylesterase
MHVKPSSQYIPSGDALIYCEVFGREDAPVLLFLHGNGEDLHIFDSQIRYFSRYFKTVAVDTRAHGLSTRGTGVFDFYTLSADLLAVLNALRIDKAHIVGFSDGAIIALHLALTAPERIASMVLLGANYNPKGLRLIPRFQIGFVYTWLSIASLFSVKMRQRKEIWALMVNQPKLTLKEISRINLPALVVTGENDMVTQHQNDDLSRAITGSGRMVIPKGDHFWFFTEPELLNQCIMNFLQKVI